MMLRELIDLLIRANASDEEVVEWVNRWDQMNGHHHDPQPAPAVVLEAKPRAHKHEGEYNFPGRSSRRASILEVQNWQSIDCAAQTLGIAARDIRHLIKTKKITPVDMGVAGQLVHVRQIANWVESKRYLEVHPEVFEEWQPAAHVAKELGIAGSTLTKYAQDGKIAYYKPHHRLLLVNIAECRAVKK